MEWPSQGQSWSVNSSSARKIEISCELGEKICYGAESTGKRVAKYWGVSSSADKCKSCCYVCAGGEYDVALSSIADMELGVRDFANDPVQPDEEGYRSNATPPAVARAASDQLQIDVRSLDQYAVELAFFSADGTRAWPGGDRIYPLKDSQFHSHTLNCQPGEKICYGAWRRGNSKSYWGAGYGGREACNNCCMRCGSGPHRYTLEPGSEGGSAVSSSDGIGNAIGAIVGGVAAGAAIGGAIRNSTPSVRSPSPRVSPPSYSGDYQPGRSGISGGR